MRFSNNPYYVFIKLDTIIPHKIKLKYKKGYLASVSREKVYIFTYYFTIISVLLQIRFLEELSGNTK
jgi:hypothetical protein